MANGIALLHIDMQYIHVHPDHSVSGMGDPEESKQYVRERLAGVTVPNIRRLLEGFRERNRLIIHVVFNHIAPDGSDLDPKIFKSFSEKNPDPRTWAIRTREDPLSAVIVEIAPQPGEIVLEKTTYSAFLSTNLDFVLKNHNIDTVVPVGGLTDCCVMRTAIDAKAHGYRIIAIPEACVSRTSEREQHGIEEPGYDETITVDECLKRMED